jgi:3-mercaptopyruvate sulfurtransferase SseA
MKLISREELREKLERGDEVKLVMTYSAFGYRTKHIPGSVNFETAADAIAALDPADEIVVYCTDVYCAASIYAHRLLEAEGYARVRRYAGGIADWEAAGYPLASLPLEPPRREARARSRASRPWRVCAAY